MTRDFASVDRWAKNLQDELNGTAAKKRMDLVGDKLKREVDTATGRTLGDQSMSGWRRGNPIEITGQADVPNVNEIVIRPTKPGRGPMRVLQSGRHMGNAGGFAGPGVNRKTGLTNYTKAGAVRKVRASRGRRWNGYTRGKGTWDDVEKAVGSKAGEAIHEIRVLYALRKTVGKG